MNTQDIGDYIKAKRESLGLTQEQLAEQVGVSPRTISNWETGKSKIKFENVEKLAEALKVSPTSIRLGKDVDRLDEDTKCVLDQIVSDLYNVEDRGLLAMEMGYLAFGLAIIALAFAWWGLMERTAVLTLLCTILFLFGVWFIVRCKLALRKLNRRVKAKREHSNI